MVGKSKKRKETEKTGSSSSKIRKQGRSKFAEEDSAQKSCGKIGNNWSGKEAKVSEILFFNRKKIDKKFEKTIYSNR